jgi:F-type H+-transporting ATPase subunit gamma
MRSYYEYKNQIEGFVDVARTVKTSEKIAASSIHLLRESLENLNLYLEAVEDIFMRLFLSYPGGGNTLLERKTAGKKILLVITGDRGLVGNLWHSVVNLAVEKSKEGYLITAVGAKGGNYLSEEKVKSENLKIEQAKEIIDGIIGEFAKGKLKKVDILYSSFISLTEQKPILVNFLPFNSDFTALNGKEEKDSGKELGLPIFEPNKRLIFDSILREYINATYRKILLEAKLSELSARTVVMEHAAVKTEDMIKELKLEYFKERRRNITQKQLESFTVHNLRLS